MHYQQLALAIFALTVNWTQAKWHFEKAQVNFIEANLICRREGRQLAVVDTPGKQLDIANIIRERSLDQQTFWISGTSLNNPRSTNYFWLSNGQPLQYSNWDENQPDNFHGEEHCVQIWKNRNQKWNDNVCSLKCNFICEDICCGCDD